MYRIFFSPVNLPYVNLIMRPAKEPKGKKGNVFCPFELKPLPPNIIIIRSSSYCDKCWLQTASLVSSQYKAELNKFNYPFTHHSSKKLKTTSMSGLVFCFLAFPDAPTWAHVPIGHGILIHSLYFSLLKRNTQN